MALKLLKLLKRKKRLEDNAASSDNKNPVDVVLADVGLVTDIVDFMPWKEQIQICSFVSKVWRSSVKLAKAPIVMRIEDKDKDQIWPFPVNLLCGKKEWKEHRIPLHRIRFIPVHITLRVTKLTLVLRYATQHAQHYAFDDFLSEDEEGYMHFLDRFPCLVDLRVLSKFGLSSVFDIFNTRNPLPELKQLCYMNSHSGHVSGQDNNPGIVTLSKIARLAPNLEKLDMPFSRGDNMKGHLNELLPLAQALQYLHIHVVSEIEGDVDSFLDNMPALQSWVFDNCQVSSRKRKHLYELPTQETLTSNAQMCPYVVFGILCDMEYWDFHLIIQERFIRWYLNAKQGHPWTYMADTLLSNAVKLGHQPSSVNSAKLGDATNNKAVYAEYIELFRPRLMAILYRTSPPEWKLKILKSQARRYVNVQHRVRKIICKEPKIWIKHKEERLIYTCTGDRLRDWVFDKYFRFQGPS